MRTEDRVQRITDPRAIEARLLDLAHTTTVKLTAPVLAYYAPCSIEDASRVLDDLASRDILSLEVEDDGTLHYELRGRQQLPAHVHAPASRALVVRETDEPRRSALLAALLTFWIPGAGHAYAGRWLAAVMWFLVVGAGYVLILPGLVLHVFAMLSAASAARLPRSPARYQLPAAA